MFDHLGSIVARHWRWVLAAWAIAVVALHFSAPPWAAISQDDDIESFPAHFDSRVGHYLLQSAFPEDVFNSQAVVVIERADGPLSDADQDVVEDIASWLNTVQKQHERYDEAGNLVEDKYGLKEFLTPKTLVKGQ